jgi:ABC-2 type transport system ATP-binding protein
MKQRLVMASAIMIEPEVIIVDEPMVGLDPIAIKMVKDLFKSLATGGTTIFMSTHTLKIAEEVCDRIGVINGGSLIATGSPTDLIDEAKTSERNLEAVFLKLTEEGTMSGRAN